MGAAVFALIFLSLGYWFLRRWRISRPHLFKSDGHAFYFSVVLAAIVVVVEATMMRVFATSVSVEVPLDHYLDRFLSALATEPKLYNMGDICIWAIPTTIAMTWLANWPIIKSNSLKLKLYLRMSCLAELEEFLLQSNMRGLPVMITLGNKKVYVGFAMETQPDRDEKKWVRLEPLLSGYRNNKHEFKETTDYRWLHTGDVDDAQKVDFDVILPVAEIISVHAFDLSVYVDKFIKIKSGNQVAVDTKQEQPGVVRDVRAQDFSQTRAETYYWIFILSILSITFIGYAFNIVAMIFTIALSVLLALASIKREFAQ